jgi:hypothetical protein
MTDYATAIAHPQQFLGDAELQSAQVALKPLGMPLNWCGANAVVFQLHRNGMIWAVRCFTRSLRDQRERYEEASAYIPKTLRNSILVDFTYIVQGILVLGEWYPIVKMEWASGETLDEAIDDHVSAGNHQALLQLSNAWREVVAELRAHQVAHGDLQHANIIVNGTQIKLVDYDGIYVPPLGGQQSLELGLAHYQHPGRTGNDFDENLDNFSALVIYLSLRALAFDPSLWHRYHVEKRLILAEQDYRAPQQSTVFRELQRSTDPEVRRLTDVLKNACTGSAHALPPLESLVQANSSVSIPRPGRMQRRTEAPLPEWARPAGTASQPSATTRKTSEKRPDYTRLTPHPQPRQRPSSTALPDWMQENRQTKAGKKRK